METRIITFDWILKEKPDVIENFLIEIRKADLNMKYQLHEPCDGHRDVFWLELFNYEPFVKLLKEINRTMHVEMDKSAMDKFKDGEWTPYFTIWYLVNKIIPNSKSDDLELSSKTNDLQQDEANPLKY
jgi:hypothetical protein